MKTFPFISNQSQEPISMIFNLILLSEKHENSHGLTRLVSVTWIMYRHILVIYPNTHLVYLVNFSQEDTETNNSCYAVFTFTYGVNDEETIPTQKCVFYICENNFCYAHLDRIRVCIWSRKMKCFVKYNIFPDVGRHRQDFLGSERRRDVIMGFEASTCSFFGKY